MASVTTSIRKKRDRSRHFPFDTLGALSLAWAVVFLAMAFCLGAWLV
jgi:hypothetical protein